MSKHETALALIDEQIEKLQADKTKARGATLLAKGALERAQKEEELIEYSLTQVTTSKQALIADRQATPVEPLPGPGLFR